MKEKVLVTGVSGFLAGHVALELLNRGYSVRGSLRNLARADSVSAMLDKPGRDSGRLDFCQLDLLCDDGWADAVQGCRYVVHIASPFVLTMPKESDEILRPALDGTRRMILAALDAGVERIVLTSSVAAIDNGHRRYDHVLGPDDWTDPDGPHVTAYTRSKTLAEREAWAIAEQKGDRNVLAVINPGTIIGPLLDDDPGTSGAIIQRLLRGDMPMLPNLILPWVDVRDVAVAHAEALTSRLAAGRRTIVTNSALPLADIARILRDRLGPEASKVPTRRMPGWMTSLIAMFDRSLRDSKTYLGVQRKYDASSGTALLGRPLRTTEKVVEEMGRSLITRGLI